MRRARPLLLALLAVAAVGAAAKFIALRGWRSDRAVLALFREGVSKLERFEYLEAYKKFREVAELRPAWPGAHSNAGLAALNWRKDETTQIDYLPIAEKEFQEALRLDPSSLHARFGLGMVHKAQLRDAFEDFEEVARADPTDPFVLFEYGAILADRGDLARARSVLEEAIRIQPAFSSALYKLGSQVYKKLHEDGKRVATLNRFQALQKSREGISSGLAYGEAGKYSLALQVPFEGSELATSPEVLSARLPPLQEVGVPAVGRTRPDGSTAPPPFAVGDVDGDAVLDLVLCGQPSARATTTQVWKGDSIASSFKRIADLDANGAAVSLGDLDGDGDLDLVLVDEGAIQVFDNDGRGGFSPSKLKVPSARSGFPLKVLVFDADSDWDLDILVVRQVKVGDRIETTLDLLNNNRDGTFEDIAGKIQIALIPIAATGALFADVDEDIDQDIVLLAKEPEASLVLVNDRAWHYRRVEVKEMGGLKAVLKRAGLPRPIEDRLLEESTSLRSASLAVAADTAGRPILFEANPRRALEVVPVNPAPASWIGIEAEGVRDAKLGIWWSNLSGVGAHLEVRARGLRFQRQVLGAGVGGASGPLPAFFDIGGRDKIDYLRIVWPDGVLQSDPALEANRIHRIKEDNRKPDSCPIVFAWTGERFDYVGDFLGVGGLGYLTAPGVYSKPDPSEVLELPALAPVIDSGGAKEYRLSLIEHLEECTYLDALELVVADAPPGVTVHPQELFAVKARAPEATLLAYRTALFPDHALGGKGKDLRADLKEIDRVYDDDWNPDPRFPGAAEPHSMTLEWNEELPCGPAAPGLDDPRPALLAYGYVEYGYSTSNFAAAQAGVSPHAPTISVERGGKWIPLREEWGFPGGTPRWMAVDLGGLLRPGDRRLRIDTDMEIYFDQVFLAMATPIPLSAMSSTAVHITALPPIHAELRFRGFPEPIVPPDGSSPILYDYDDVSPDGEVKPFPGHYTRYGEVADLLSSADDRLAIFGAGDEVLARFAVDRLTPLPEGWKRTFFLSGVGYCKDMDLYTAASDRIEPLPFRSMKSYPPGPDEKPRAEASVSRNDRVVEPLILR